MRPVTTMEQSWRTLYEAAILETDRSKLNERISLAERAIQARMEEIKSDPEASREEQLAISGAISGLKILRSEMRDRSGTVGS